MISARDPIPQRAERATDAVDALDAHLRQIAATTHEGVWALDQKGRTVFANERLCALLGREQSQILGKSIVSFARAGDRRSLRALLGGVRAGRKVQTETRLVRPDGREQWVQLSASAVPGADGAFLGSLAMVTDVTDQHALTTALLHSKRRHAEAEALAGMGSWEWDLTTGIAERSPGLCRILGAGPDRYERYEDLLARVHPDDRPRFDARMQRVLKSGRSFDLEHRVIHPDGTSRVVRSRAAVRERTRKTAGRLEMSVEDVTDEREVQAALHHQALHDPLTGLANRALLYDRLVQASIYARRSQGGFALLFCDLDDFKAVNDTFGHDVGDQLLHQIARRWRDLFRASDTVARLGGDEFALLLPGMDVAGAEKAARKLAAALEAPFVVNDHEVAVEVSVGAAVYPAHGEEPEALLRHADLAMYAAKRTRSGFALYGEATDTASGRPMLLAELRRAIAGDQLRLLYQPVIALPGRNVIAVEALVRWQHPVRGAVGPGEFVPVAEESGLIGPLTEWVLRTALAQLAAWLREGQVIDMAVNVSARNLLDPRFPALVAALLDQAAVPAERLTLEMTERVFVTDPERASAAIGQLRATGVRLSIDDFGSGHSSLSYLLGLPVDALKIDRSFVTGMRSDGRRLAVARAAIALGHGLGFAIVAEGVEDEATLELLAEMGCDSIQGYVISRPVGADEISSRYFPIRTSGPDRAPSYRRETIEGADVRVRHLH